MGLFNVYYLTTSACRILFCSIFPNESKLIGFNVIDPVFGLLVCCRFTHIVVLIPRVLMENFHFSVGHLFGIFHTDKAVTLVFNLSSVEETTNTEEAGLFGHFTLTTFPTNIKLDITLVI